MDKTPEQPTPHARRSRWALAPLSGLSTTARWGVGGALALLAALIFFLFIFDWNWLRGPVSKFASAQLQREVKIEGNLRVHPWSLTPRASIEGLRVGQPKWAPQGHMAKVDRIAVQVKLLPLFKGDIVLPLLAIEKPDVILLREASGRANWTFGDPNKKRDKPLKLPAIQHFIIDDGELRYDDAQKGLSFRGMVSSNERAIGSERGRFLLEGKGELNRAPFLARITGGPLLNVSPNRPYPFDAEVRAGTTLVLAKGAINKPFDLGRFGADLTLAGQDLNNLYYLTGLALPNTPPYRVSGRLERKGSLYDVGNLKGRIGDSDIGGKLSVETGRERPLLTADLRSRRLDFDDLGSLLGGTPATGGGETASDGQKQIAGQLRAQQRLLPDSTLQVERIRAMDAKVRYRALAVNAPNLPLRRVSLDLNLNDGVLVMDPLSFDFARGRLTSQIKLDATGKTPRTDADVRLTNAALQDFIPIKTDGVPAIEGAMAARAKLTGYGNSVHRAASSANGSVTMVVPRGKIRQAFAELLGVNASKGLLLLLAKSNKETDVRCAVADFKVVDGVLRANTIVFDTGVVLAKGTGTVDLETERMAFRIEGDSKKPRLVRLFLPITVEGPLMQPKVGVDAGSAVAQGGVAAALGALLTPLAVLLPFVDPGLEKDADCQGLVASARGKGAPLTSVSAQTAPNKAD
ncbi:AsmA family protein [Caulobacter sp. NIBR2454]|uniref:AsmA family protein n=1 Tax=Caulobacter sp. NIBR2454 TaxID=3015996 RepID=UPI0022B667A0|nr:AsmA family protein [Caulobacter sp. NIBR2454]